MQEDEDFVRKGPVLLPKACERVVDADEEIFILYSEIKTGTPPESADKFRGLGYVDSHKDVLEIKFELKNVVSSTSVTQLTGKRKNKFQKVTKDLEKTVEIELWQDKTSLRSRKGDTGSVLWKASIDFAQLVLQQYYSGSNNGLFDRELLSTANLVELGSGTGLLSLALSPLVGHYTATDIGPLIPLMQKNVTLNFPGWPSLSSGNKGANISLEELDWMAIEAATPSQRVKIYDTEAQPIDLLLIVDCIYHPSLIPPFLTTVDYLTTSDRTAVLVVSELRAEDVMREFLEQWLSIPGWGVWRIPNDLLGKHYVIYLGWKV